GYGAYGLPYPVNFSSSRLSLLDRGVSVALAHVRGGGEGGKRWHDAGRMLAKPNTFTDFVAAADHLVAQGYTARDRLVIGGGCAHGRPRRPCSSRSTWRRATAAPRAVTITCARSPSTTPGSWVASEGPREDRAPRAPARRRRQGRARLPQAHHR